RDLEVLRLVNEALEAFRRIEGENSVFAAVAHLQNAVLAESTRNYAAAVQLCDKSLEVALSHLGTDHGFIALIYFQKGLALEQLGQLAAAEKAYRACLQTGLKTVGGAHPKVLVVLDRLAYLLGRQNHVPDAKQLLAANLQVRRDQLEKDDLGLAEIL